MQSFLFATVTIVLLGLCIPQSMAGMKQLKCRGQSITLSEEDAQGAKDCMKQFAPDANLEDDEDKIKSVIPKDKMACLGKCILMKQGVLDDKGMPCTDKDKMMAKIKGSMPQEVVDDMIAGFGKCIEANGGTLDNNETTCESYQPFVNCLTIGFVEICKPGE